MNRQVANLIRFDRGEVTFNSSLLELGKIEEKKRTDNWEVQNFASVPIKYNNSRIQIKLPLAELNGIYYNKDLNSYSLAYPLDEGSFEPEIFHFNNWMKNFEECIRLKLQEINVLGMPPIYKDSKYGKTLYVTFKAANGTLNQRCIDFNTEPKDINTCIGAFGDYIIVADVPSVYINSKIIKVQFFGNAIVVKSKPREELNLADLI